MSAFFHSLLHLFISLNYLGPFILGVMDSSFLVFPFGNDLLVVALIANHHQGYLLYVLSAVCGSTTGVFLLDLVARKLGEEGIQKVTGRDRFNKLKEKIGKRGGFAVVVACLAPPPFPFMPVIVTNIALGYPRRKLLLLVAASRAARFLILGYLAIRFGPAIMDVVKSSDFRWAMIGFIALCVVASVFSAIKWLRHSRNRKSTKGSQ
ncbi:MAG TPA: hypothetical protein VF283_16875 [Bryobacteraceae bacterium]